jgi:hypothetical protein
MSNRLVLDPGSRRIARFRPEHVRLHLRDAGAPAPDTLTIPGCEVLDRSFLGEETEYTLRAQDVVLKARIDGPDGRIDVGDRAVATVEGGQLAVFSG